MFAPILENASSRRAARFHREEGTLRVREESADSGRLIQMCSGGLRLRLPAVRTARVSPTQPGARTHGRAERGPKIPAGGVWSTSLSGASGEQLFGVGVGRSGPGRFDRTRRRRRHQFLDLKRPQTREETSSRQNEARRAAPQVLTWPLEEGIRATLLSLRGKSCLYFQFHE